MNDNTINTAEIAELLHVTREYVTDKLSKRPDFPRPVVNFSQRSRRWKRDQIETWAGTRQKQAA
jgi:predicted DNA-binding transcriptional regulator AlpA